MTPRNARYLELIARRDDPAAVAEIVRLIDPWIGKRATYYANRRGATNTDIEDMCAEARLAIVEKAIPKFSLVSGASFATYATFWIDNALRNWYENHSTTVYVPAGTQQRAYELLDTIDPASFRAAILTAVQKNHHVTSLDVPRTRNTGDTIAWVDRLADEGLLADDAFENAERYATLHKAMRRLHPRAREVLWARANDQTLQEIANRLGLSRERIRQIEEVALDKLREILHAEPRASPSIAGARCVIWGKRAVA
jgi:RNA polymerase sigma factor (sigma-70 family)